MRIVLLIGNGCLFAQPPEGAILEFRPSYFYPTSSTFRKIFDGSVNYQLTGTAPIGLCSRYEWVRSINLWGGVDYFSKTGHSQGLHDKTRIRMVPLTLGLKYFLPSCSRGYPLNFYAAGGMKYYFLQTHNHSEQVKNKINKNGMGGVVEVGFITTLRECFILDLFASYSFKSFGAPSSSDPAVKGTSLNISGLNVGAGIGYKF